MLLLNRGGTFLSGRVGNVVSWFSLSLGCGIQGYKGLKCTTPAPKLSNPINLISPQIFRNRSSVTPKMRQIVFPTSWECLWTAFLKNQLQITLKLRLLDTNGLQKVPNSWLEGHNSHFRYNLGIFVALCRPQNLDRVSQFSGGRGALLQRKMTLWARSPERVTFAWVWSQNQ